jgi:predicted pyridoxine 5'-phosphate oxidase superfamily flavin-nucleotide-binding protein
MSYHEGELQIQRQAGVLALADRMVPPRADIPAVAAAFVAAQQFVVASTVDVRGAVTASLLGGPPAFAFATDPRTLTITAVCGHITRVGADVDATGVIGLLAIDLAARRRMRLNGRAVQRGATIAITTEEVYANCPQYIHPRAVVEDIAERRAERVGRELTPRQQEWIRVADTFFISTTHPERGADASHRGGASGFVRVESSKCVLWPDYRGNNMFNSLGNLVVNPRCGLLFVDFTRGATLQLRGSAAVQEDRTVILDVEEVVQTENATPLRWTNVADRTL